MSIILALAIVVPMCACGNSNANSKVENDNSSNNEINSSEKDSVITEENVGGVEDIQEAEVGTLLDVPEKLFELDKFYVYLNYPDDSNESGISTMEIALDDTRSPGVVYLTSGTMKLDEYIYELDDEGNVTKYYKDIFMTEFVKVDDVSQEELQEEKLTVMALMKSVGWCADSYYEGVKYKKCDNVYDPFWGEVFTYELIYEDEVLSKIYVDKATGLWVKEEIDGEQSMRVTNYSETDLGIPEYK